MIEGDLTLLLAASRMKPSRRYSFAGWFLPARSAAAFSDNIAYLTGREFRKGVRDLRFIARQATHERLTNNFGDSPSFFRNTFTGCAGPRAFSWRRAHAYLRFMLLSLASCFAWVSLLSGAGYFFQRRGDRNHRRLSAARQSVAGYCVVGITGFYLAERFWLSKKLKRLTGTFAGAGAGGTEKLQELKQEFQEHIRLAVASRRAEKTN